MVEGRIFLSRVKKRFATWRAMRGDYIRNADRFTRLLVAHDCGITGQPAEVAELASYRRFED